MAHPLPAPDPPPRILLATVGVGVPLDDAVLLIGVLAAEAVRIGYRDVIVENEQVSAALPEGRPLGTTAETCPACLREIRRYPGGKFYTHHCAQETP